MVAGRREQSGSPEMHFQLRTLETTKNTSGCKIIVVQIRKGPQCLKFTCYIDGP